jgi:hypothetical protein
VESSSQLVESSGHYQQLKKLLKLKKNKSKIYCLKKLMTYIFKHITSPYANLLSRVLVKSQCFSQHDFSERGLTSIYLSISM